MANPGFYKLNDNLLRFAPTGVYAPNFTLLAADQETYTYPVDGWRYFASLEDAESFFGINGLNGYLSLKNQLDDSDLYDVVTNKQTPSHTIAAKNARAQSGGSNFLILAADAPADNNAYRGSIMNVTQGTGLGEAFVCIAYDGTTKRADFIRTSGNGAALVMDGTTRYFMFPLENIYEIASSSAAVWAIERTTRQFEAILSKLATSGDNGDATKISRFQARLTAWVNAVNFNTTDRDILRAYLLQYVPTRGYTVP